MRRRSGTVNRLPLKYAAYLSIQESSLRMTDNFALAPEYAPVVATPLVTCLHGAVEQRMRQACFAQENGEFHV